MTRPFLLSVLAAALVAPTPAMAASLYDPVHNGRDRISRPGAFAGVRIRVSGDGKDRTPVVRGGIAVAPIRTSGSSAGGVEHRFGEGLEFGFQARNGKLNFVSTADRVYEADSRSEFSSRTTLFVIGGVVLVAVAGVVVTALVIRDEQDEE